MDTRIKPNGVALDATPELSATVEVVSPTFYWMPKQPDEAKFCQLLAINAGGCDKTLATGITPRDFKDEKAARIVEAVFALLDSGTDPTPERIAAEANKRAADALDNDRQADYGQWKRVAEIAENDLMRLPAPLPNNANIAEETAKLASKIVAKRSKRTKRDEPTPDEITATAQAFSEKIGATSFPDLPASAIPKPALQIGEKVEYDPHQLRELLYPDFKTVSLCTEAAHAERATLYIGEDVLFVSGLGFLHYDETRGQWRTDDKDGSITAAKLAGLAPIIRKEAAALLRCAATLASAGRDADARAMSRGANDVLNHAKQVEKRSFLSGAATFLAAKCRGDVEQFAPAAWKFAFKNCVFDKGKWRQARRDDFFLNVSPVPVVGGADRTEWMALLNRITGGDVEFARTLQDACAYALSGASTLRALMWAYGTKGTGKGTVCELLQTVLGDASATIDTALLQDNSSRERLGAALWGKRAAFVAEAGNKRIDAELLKTLSGGDRLSVRRLYQEAFTAKPSHALFLAANDAPKTDAYDDALKDRVIALPFVHPLNDGDPLQFAGHTRVEAARTDADSPLLRGFAAWLGDGLERLYQSQEIYKAPAVEAATAKFWADTDPVSEFWSTVDEADLRDGMPKSELRARYEFWCQAEGARPLNRNQWARACQSHGLESDRRTDEKRTVIWIL
jgi:putative DNA primase/helicase